MDFFFNPRSVAVIGATPDINKGGYSILKNLILGFQGRILPVNPKYDEIEGLKCFPSVRDIPEPPDLSLVFVPAHLVPGVVRECAQAGVKGAMLESGGFAETGPQGQALQEELKEIAAQTGIRLWGPNCMGLVDLKNSRLFSFVSPAIWDDGLLAGEISLIVQSGMLSAGFLIDLMTHGQAGVSKVCSIGNRVDVDEVELLEFLLNDPQTKAVGLYLESIPQGRRFALACAGAPKPIVVLKGGRSAQGAKAALSHTASLAGNGALISGILNQVGVVEASDFKQMVDLTRSLAAFPQLDRERGNRVAVLTFTGGAGILSLDFMEDLGLAPADLSQETLKKLEKVFPDWMPAANPVDLWPAVERLGAEQAYRQATLAVLEDPGVDAVLFHVFSGAFRFDFDVAPLARVARKAGKPMMAWLLGRRGPAKETQTAYQAAGVPVFRELYRAVESLAAVMVGRPESSGPRLEQESEPPSLSKRWQRRLVRERGVLDEYDSKQVLGEAGLPMVEEALAPSAQEAGLIAASLGFPVVLKGLAPGLVHKTEAGLVQMGVESEDEAVRVFGRLKAAVGREGRVLVQSQVSGELELMVGFVRDPQFGPCVMCGLGGVLAEVMGKVGFGLAPLDEAAALELIKDLGVDNLLDGFRGRPRVDRRALARVLTDLGRLGAAQSGIKEIDLNPLIISRGLPLAVDATIVLED